MRGPNPAGGHASPSEVMYPGGPQIDGGLLAPGDPIPENAGPGGRRPEWLKVRIGAGATYADTKRVIRGEALNTVCEEARCPNIGECWALGHGHLHDPRQRLHPELRLLRHRHRPAADHRPRRAAARGRGDEAHEPEARRRHHGRPRRPARRRRRMVAETIRQIRLAEPRHQHRGPDQRPQRPAGRHPHRGRGAARHPEPQRRDGAAPPARGPTSRALGSVRFGADAWARGGATRSASTAWSPRPG